MSIKCNFCDVITKLLHFWRPALPYRLPLGSIANLTARAKPEFSKYDQFGLYFGHYRWYRFSLLLFFGNTGCFQGDGKVFYDEKKKLITQALKYLKRFANRIKKNSSITFVWEIGIILKLKRYYNQLSPPGYFGQLKNGEGEGN